MRLRPTRILTSAFLVAIGLANASHAQTTTSGGLTGVVSDQGKAVLPDAVVELRDDGSGITRSTKTDREGLYRFFFLAPAKYTLSVTHEGFKTDQRTVGVLLGP